MAKVPRKLWRRLTPKLLLLLAYTVVIVFLSALFFMKNELRRVGFFSTESTSPPPAQSPSSPAPSPAPGIPGEPQSASSPSPGTTMRAETVPPSRQAEEITRDDKKQLDDILRARGGK